MWSERDRRDRCRDGVGGWLAGWGSVSAARAAAQVSKQLAGGDVAAEATVGEGTASRIYMHASIKRMDIYQENASDPPEPISLPPC